MDISSTREPITLYRHGHLSFLMCDDEYCVINDEYLPRGDWDSIDFYIGLAVNWLHLAYEWGIDTLHIAEFIKDYVGEAQWTLAILENL